MGLEFLTDESRRAELASLQTRADEQLYADPAYRAELAEWIRRGLLGTTGLRARVTGLAVRYLDVGAREGQKNAALVESAPAVAVLTVETETVPSWLRAGRAFQRLALSATSEGLAVHLMSQILEVERHRDELAALLGLEGATPVHLFRLGEADFEEDERTDRRPVADVLL